MKELETFKKFLNEEEQVNEQELDIDKPGNPLYDLNNNDVAVDALDSIIEKFGITAVQLWVTSGNYPQEY